MLAWNTARKAVFQALTGPSGATTANTNQDDDQDDDQDDEQDDEQDGDQDDTGKGTRLYKYPCDILIISLMGSVLRWSINNYWKLNREKRFWDAWWQQIYQLQSIVLGHVRILRTT